MAEKETKTTVQTKEDANKRFTITTTSGSQIVLTKDTVQKYLTGNTQISDSEFNMFFQLCKEYKVNPYLREAYIIKYGSQAAQIVIDYKFLQARAEKDPHFRGMKTGIVVLDKDGNEKEKNSTIVLPNETLIAGWCEILRSDRDCPTKVYCMFSEYNTGKSNWNSKPTFMIVKVAKAQALREAFPNMIKSNIYTQEEASTFEEAYYKAEVVEKKETTVSNSIIDDLPEEFASDSDLEPASDELPFDDTVVDENGVVKNA